MLSGLARRKARRKSRKHRCLTLFHCGWCGFDSSLKFSQKSARTHGPPRSLPPAPSLLRQHGIPLAQGRPGGTSSCGSSGIRGSLFSPVKLFAQSSSGTVLGSGQTPGHLITAAHSGLGVSALTQAGGQLFSVHEQQSRPPWTGARYWPHSFCSSPQCPAAPRGPVAAGSLSQLRQKILVRLAEDKLWGSASDEGEDSHYHFPPFSSHQGVSCSGPWL